MQPGVDYIWKPQIAEAVSKREIHVLTNWRNQSICASFTVWLSSKDFRENNQNFLLPLN